jgi:hypothetical protein
VIEVAQHERRTGDAERRIGRCDEIDADIDDVDRAEPKRFISWFSLPSWEAGNTVMSNLPLVRFLISLAAHSASVW